MLNSFLATDDNQDNKNEDWRPLASAEFDALREAHDGHPHKEKMVDTIYHLVDHRISGKPETAVFKLPKSFNTCSRNTYTTKWKHDPAFSACLKNVTKLALEWKDGRYARALKTAAERLQLASPNAAARLVVLLADRDPNVVYRAATAILDRAGVETANKDGQLINLIMNSVDLSLLSDQQLDDLQKAKSATDIIQVLLRK